MPEISAIHVDQPLTNLAIAFPAQSFIAPRVMPDLLVNKKSDVFYKFDTAQNVKKQYEDRRAPGAEANMLDFDVTTDSYLCTGHALASAVPDEEYENADPVFQPLVDKVDFIAERLMLNMEIDFKSAVDGSSPGGATLVNGWDDELNGDPIGDIDTGINTIEDAVGLTPNIAWCDSKTWRILRKHPKILERVLYGGENANPAQISTSAVASIFGLDDIVVAASLKNTAQEGQATASLSRIWGEDFYLSYRAPRPGIKTISFGYRFTWRPFSGSRNGWVVKRWREDKRSSDLVQVEKWYTQKIVSASCIYRIQNTKTLS